MTPTEFVNLLLQPAKDIETSHKVPYLFTIGQAALESGWGKSAIGNNLFGIKANKGWTGLKKLVTTTEWFKDDKQGGLFPEVISITPVNGKFKYIVKDWFRDYATIQECLLDHARFLIENKRYAKAFQFTDPYSFSDEVAKAGYATDPNYRNVMRSMITSVKNKIK
jgi:flagellar protein FlgJ